MVATMSAAGVQGPDGSVKDDLAYVAVVAAAARSAPLLGGRFLVFWGILVSAAWAAQWAVLSGAAGVGTSWLAAVWIAFAVIAGLGMFLLIRSIKGKPGLGTIANRVNTAVWTGAGFGLFSYVGGIIVAGSIGALAEPNPVFDTILSVAFVVYAVAFLATAAASGQGWLRLFAALSFTGAGIVPFFVGDPLVYLISAVIVFVVAVVPGVIFLRREPQSLRDEGIAETG